MTIPAGEELRSRARAVRLLLLDVDGVLTDGVVYLNPEGEETKGFHIRDGSGIVLLKKSGVRVGLVTGRASGALAARARELHIEEVHQGIDDKIAVYERLREKYGLTDAEVAYVGDDVLDLPVLKRAGLAVGVADAHPRVLEVVHWVTEKTGGRGAVREVCDFLMSVQAGD
jgi:3-deoxy-D-manno-octulosonate 8-phosphate phosphatase (KDO 8-P phosphatase)